MSEQKWKELASRIEHIVSAYNRARKERDELKKEIENLKLNNTKLAKETKDEVLLKERIKILEDERKLIQEKVKKLLKMLKEF